MTLSTTQLNQLHHDPQNPPAEGTVVETTADFTLVRFATSDGELRYVVGHSTVADGVWRLGPGCRSLATFEQRFLWHRLRSEV